MHIDVFVTHVGLREKDARDKLIVVIDVLRASTTICTALSNGAKEVIPVNSIEQAMQLSGDLFADTTIVGGERGGVKVRGFDLGNSPSEYTPGTVQGKSVILTTTNGTEALVKSRTGSQVLVGSFVNASAVTEALANADEDMLIVCAGREQRFSLEDFYCAGMIINGIRETRNARDVTVSDTASVAEITFKNYSDDPVQVLKDAAHGQSLIDLGFEDDLYICGEINRVPVLPVYHEGRITIPAS